MALSRDTQRFFGHVLDELYADVILIGCPEETCAVEVGEYCINPFTKQIKKAPCWKRMRAAENTYPAEARET